ncbi:MAG TPA: hypothetical protein VIH37_00685, partial [Candidatus Limnocylindrales bacterium]
MSTSFWRSRRANRWPGRAWSNSTRVHHRFLGAIAAIFAAGLITGVAVAMISSGSLALLGAAQPSTPSIA